MEQDLSRNTVLIVDDARANVAILSETLAAHCRIATAASGDLALEYLKNNPADLILLDIMMPRMDGFALCTRLKQSERLRDIPVIFITVMDAAEDKTRGFTLGAVDYITKPFEPQEVLSRVKAHLTIRQQGNQLKDLASRMAEESSRQARDPETSGNFATALANEINDPLTAIMSAIDLLELFWEKALPVMERHAREDASGYLSRQFRTVAGMHQNIRTGCARISELVESMPDIFSERK